MNTRSRPIDRPTRLGAQVMGTGVQFALFSQHATGVELCLFDGGKESRIPLTGRRDHIWHGFVEGLKPGQRYGYRVDGPYEPEKGHRFNKNKLLLDPYGLAVDGTVNWGPELFGYIVGHADKDLSFDTRDSGARMPKSVVVDTAFDWGQDQRPYIPMAESIIYEAHVKGFSKLSDVVPDPLRGSYAGLGSPQAIEYFRKLGVTAVELLPIHHHVDSDRLLGLGLCDYWGYNNIGYFAPEAKYSSDRAAGAEVREFKTMVKALHAAGIEVLLDVVYNHTAEGSELGPTLCYRGIDNASYYHLVAETPRHTMDFTGTGNSFNVPHARTLQLVMDSLRYWVEEMHVDGFRFDLAPTLGRGAKDFSRDAAFFQVAQQDPVLSQVKLIAEPWDVGDNGYQVGGFPTPWAEWNGKYRDAVRRFWKGDTGLNREFASRFIGSPDIYQGRAPSDSVNFVTAHDGYSLRDLVSFADKHNEANGEENRDGDNNNASWNWGHEGLDAPEEILALRRKMERNFFATLLLSQGVPMIRMGDEFGATQKGNNNAYCQDNELSWMDWKAAKANEGLREFVTKLISLRREHPLFRQTGFLAAGKDEKAVAVWLSPKGEALDDEGLAHEQTTAFGLLLRSEAARNPDKAKRRGNDPSYFIAFNPHHEDVPFVLPEGPKTLWLALIDTNEDPSFVSPKTGLSGGSSCPAKSRSLKVFVSGSST